MAKTIALRIEELAEEVRQSEFRLSELKMALNRVRKLAKENQTVESRLLLAILAAVAMDES